MTVFNNPAVAPARHRNMLFENTHHTPSLACASKLRGAALSLTHPHVQPSAFSRTFAPKPVVQHHTTRAIRVVHPSGCPERAALFCAWGAPKHPGSRPRRTPSATCRSGSSRCRPSRRRPNRTRLRGAEAMGEIHEAHCESEAGEAAPLPQTGSSSNSTKHASTSSTAR